MFILMLNDIRSPKIEILQNVCRAKLRSDLDELMIREKTNVYIDEVDGVKWAKTFRKNGPLEWFNAPNGRDYILDVGNLNSWKEDAERQAETAWTDQVMTVTPLDVLDAHPTGESDD